MRDPGGVPEWPKGTGCKPVGSAYGGSNPPAPIASSIFGSNNIFSNTARTGRTSRALAGPFEGSSRLVGRRELPKRQA